MSSQGIDYQALFDATPSPYLVLGPDLVVEEVNEAYLRATGRTREELVGRYIFGVHPDNPADPGAQGEHNLNASLQRVLRLKKPDTMAVQKYDVPVSGRPGVFQEKWWSPINTPVLAPDGQVRWIIHRVEDMTAFMLARPVRSRPEDLGDQWETMEAEIYARAQELQRLNEELREAHARERRTALTLQEAMLHSPDLAEHRDIAVRYMPATRSLNVCGDWYDVVDLSEDRFTVAVGDVVGHGLRAAAVMGMLRSALSAAMRADNDPSRAMEVLDQYTGAYEDALATTAIKAVIDTRRRCVTYTSAGHPPPALARADGTCVLLDRATAPPLGVAPDPAQRPRATLSYAPGDTLVLYSDGLVERRGEDIDVGVHRLTEALVRHTHLPPEELADTLLAHAGVADGGDDDVVLVVVRL